MSVLEAVHYSSQGVRAQTQELASWALEDADPLRAGPSSTRGHAASDSSLHPRPLLGSLIGDTDTDIHTLLDSSRPEAIDEVSEPMSPESQTLNVPAGSHNSALTHMFKTFSGNMAEDDTEAGGAQESKRAGSDRAPSIILQGGNVDDMQENAALLPKPGSSGRPDKRQYGTTSEDNSPHVRTIDAWAKVRDRIAAVLYTVVNPKNWDKRTMWRKAIVEPAKTTPAVFLGWLLNVLDALSYGRMCAKNLTKQTSLTASRHDLIPSGGETI